MEPTEPDPRGNEGNTAREAEIRRLTRQVMEEDAELLERLGSGPSDVDEVLDAELPRYDDAMKRLAE